MVGSDAFNYSNSPFLSGDMCSFFGEAKPPENEGSF